MTPDSSLESNWSPCYITAEEMQANAGEFGLAVPAHWQHSEKGSDGERYKLPTAKWVEANFAQQAKDKIAMWPLVGDTKAPRVGVRA